MRLLSNLWWRLIRFGFRLLYYEFAFTYDIVSQLVSLGAWREWQRTVFDYLPQPETGTVLELAHGTGDLQIDLAQRGFDRIGYDLSPHMGRLARKKLLRDKLPVMLVQGRAQELPFAASTFRTVVSTFPTKFIFQEETLSEIYRVLTDAGMLVVVLSGTLEGKGFLRSVLEWLFKITGQRGIESNQATTFQRIRDQLHERGFEARIVEEQCDRSIALLVVGTKIVLPNSS